MNMSRLARVPLLALVAIGAGGAGRAARAQDPSEYVGQAVGRLAGSIINASREADVGYNDGLSLFGAFMEKGTSTALSQELLPGRTYLIAGSGDDDATDVDLEIFYPDGRLAASDTEVDALPVVAFTPTQRGYYSIKLELHEGQTRTSFCAMAILREGGWQIPADNMVRACVRALTVRNGLAERGLNLKFHDAPNQWAFFGGIVPQGQEAELSQISLGQGYRVVAAAGDDHATDLDSYLSDGAGIVAKDEAEDALPIVDHRSIEGRAYTYRVKNVESDGPPLVVAVILSD